MSGTVLAAALAAAVVFGAAPDPGDLRIDPPLVQPGAGYPVEEVMFPAATADGAVVEGGGTIRMSADVMFDLDRAELTARARQELARVVDELRTAGVTAADVLGYTDDVGADGYNLRLSRARAESVRAELAGALGPGVALTADGRGEAEPVADNATDAGRALNRRVEIRY